MSFDRLAGRTIVGHEIPKLPRGVDSEVEALDLLLDDGTRVRITPTGWEADGLAADVVTPEQHAAELAERKEWDAWRATQKRPADTDPETAGMLNDLRASVNRQFY